MHERQCRWLPGRRHFRFIGAKGESRSHPEFADRCVESSHAATLEACNQFRSGNFHHDVPTHAVVAVRLWYGPLFDRLSQRLTDSKSQTIL
jgi:hypothetical protein